MENLFRRTTLLGLVSALALSNSIASASSHREALAVLNEPCADTTDIYAWVKPGDHDKLYLVANFLPLHEPGQGNQGLRACNGYRYEFNIGMGERLHSRVIYRVEFNNSLSADQPPSANDPLGGGNEILWQLSGGTETARVSRVGRRISLFGDRGQRILGEDLEVAPNNHGPQSDRLAFGLGEFQGYDSGDPTSREAGLYDDDFIRDNFIHDLSNGGRFFAGQRDDPFYLDEKGIFDAVNLCREGLFGIPGARDTPCEDVFAGFNVFTIALEIPIIDLFPNGIPHNGVLDTNSTDSLLRIWFGVERQEIAVVDPDNNITGIKYSGKFTQVGRQALPLFNATLVGTAKQTRYLRSKPTSDISNFAGEILFPILVRDAEALGIYAALSIDPDAAGLKGPRTDIIDTINLGRPIRIADGFTGDVITLDAAIDSQFPNGRVLGSGSDVASNQEQVDVSDVMLSLIVAGNPAAGVGDGVDANDKTYLTEFPFAALPHQGVSEGHGAVNEPN